MTTESAPTIEASSKLTIKVLGCEPSKVKELPEGQTKLPIARFYGRASETKTQENRDTATMDTFFAGVFEGVNLQDGEIFQSNKLFLPRGVTEMVEKALEVAHQTNKKASVVFAFEIRSVKASNKSGYTYEAATLIVPAPEDQLKPMRESLAKIKPITDEPAKAAAPRAVDHATRKSA